jgi:simple sugar transport system ATP-binding protein
LDIGDVKEGRLVELMFGDVAPPAVHAERTSRAPASASVLELGSLRVAASEIVGVAGIAGSGQRELALEVVGLAQPRGPRLLVGEDATKWSARRIREAGVGFVPESALGEELIGNMTLTENIALGSPRRFSRRGGFSVDWQAVRNDWTGRFAELELNLPDPATRVGTLSGGNAQRFAVARELARNPRLLVVLYPTRGLDVVTTAAVQRLLLRARTSGCAVLLVSQDLAELRSLSDRLLVMRDGKIVAEVDPTKADAYDIGRLMTGGDE